MSELSHIHDAVAAGNYKDIVDLVKKAIENKVSLDEIINKALSLAMLEVGDKFGSGELYMPDILLAAKSMKTAMDYIKPLLKGSEHVAEKGVLVIGTVKGDLHDIGKNIVASMLEGAGFQIIDLGVDVSPEKYYNAVLENKAEFIGLSALLTTTMVNMKNVIDMLVINNIRNTVKVMIGGAPITDEYAKKIGADGYAKDAPSAVELCKRWIAA